MNNTKNKMKPVKAWAVVNNWETLEYISKHGFSKFPIFASKDGAEFFKGLSTSYQNAKIIPVLVTPIQRKKKKV